MAGDCLSQDEINELLNQIGCNDTENKSVLENYDKEDFSSSFCFPSFISRYLRKIYSSFFYLLSSNVEESIGENDRYDPLSLSNDCFSLMNINVLSFKKLQEELTDPSYRRTIPFCPYTPITKEAWVNGNENEKVLVSTTLECLNDCLSNYLNEEFSNIHEFALKNLFLNPIAKVFRNETDNKKTLQYKMGENLYFDQTLLKDDGNVYDQWIKIEIPVNAFTHPFYLCISMKVKTILSLISIDYPVNFVPNSSYYEDKKFVVKMGRKNLSEEYISKLKDGDILDFNCSIEDPLIFCVNNKVKGEGKLVKQKYDYDNKIYTLYVTKICEEDETDEFNSYVALNYDEMEENYDYKNDSFIKLNTTKNEPLPLVHNGNVVAMVRIINYDGKILFEILRKALYQ